MIIKIISPTLQANTFASDSFSGIRSCDRILLIQPLVVAQFGCVFHGSHRSEWTLCANHGLKTGSHSFKLSGGAHHGIVWFAPFKAVFWLWGGWNLCCTLSVYYVAANFATNMVCNFPDDEISRFIDRITNIRSRFGLILETYRSNLQNGKQYSAENVYLIGRRQLLLGTGSNHRNWSHFRFEPVRTPPVRTGENHGKLVIEAESY